MTALPPAGHLRDELAELAWGVLVVCQREGVTDLNVIAHSLVGNQLPVVARALTEARADGAVDALMWSALTVEHSPGIRHQAKAVRAIRDRATTLRASIRQADERNDR